MPPKIRTRQTRFMLRRVTSRYLRRQFARGRTIDVHALRHSFGTLLSKGGVAPRTAQAAKRHSSIDLTMNTYTDPKLLDVHGALMRPVASFSIPLDIKVEFGFNRELRHERVGRH
jgi:integrase